MEPSINAHTNYPVLAPIHPDSLHSSTIDGVPVLTTKPLSSSQFGNTAPTGHSGNYSESHLFDNTRPTGNASAGISSGGAPFSSTGSTGTSASNARDSAQSAADNVAYTASNARDSARDSVQSAADNVANTASNARDSAKSTADNVANKIDENAPTVAGLRQRVNSLGTQVNSSVNNLGASVNSSARNIGETLNNAAEHPVVKDAKAGAVKQVDHLREYLGQSPLLVRAEKRLNVDRVVLVAGGIFAYILLIPLNFLHLALFTTDLLTFIPPLLLSARVLEQPNEQRTKLLLSYFTVFGFVQFIESLMAGFLAKTIPQYYTVKLLFLAYLIHPQTKGAFKFYEAVLRPVFTRPASSSSSYTSTPPSSHPFTSSASSPTHQSSGFSTAGTTGNATAITNTGFTSSGTAGGADNGVYASSGSVHLPSGGGTGLGGEAPAQPLAGTRMGQF